MHLGATKGVFHNAAKLRETMTSEEILIWEYLRTKPNGFKFRRQHPLSGYVLDFYCHKLRLSIEIDGGYHLRREQKQKDTERTMYLNEVGITEIRFTNNQVSGDLESVIETIRNHLRADSL